MDWKPKQTTTRGETADDFELLNAVRRGELTAGELAVINGVLELCDWTLRTYEIGGTPKNIVQAAALLEKVREQFTILKHVYSSRRAPWVERLAR